MIVRHNGYSQYIINDSIKLFKYDVKGYDKEYKKIDDMYYIMTKLNIDQYEFIQNIYRDTWMQITINA